MNEPERIQWFLRSWRAPCRTVNGSVMVSLNVTVTLSINETVTVSVNDIKHENTNPRTFMQIAISL